MNDKDRAARVHADAEDHRNERHCARRHEQAIRDSEREQMLRRVRDRLRAVGPVEDPTLAVDHDGCTG